VLDIQTLDRILTCLQVNCKYCDTWQHLHCYGFTGDDDERLPKDHVCYHCLLVLEEPETLSKLLPLVQRRRIIHHVSGFGQKKPSEIAAELSKSS